jgi:hypothetical protein
MKNTNFLLVAMIATLAVFAVSCMPARELGEYDEPVSSRPVYNSPYGSNVIVVERDPYTGRYYQVSPSNGYYLNDPYYNSYYSNRYYNNSYGRNTGRYYDNRRVYNNTNTNTNNEVKRQPTDDEKQRARDKVFGKRN